MYQYLFSFAPSVILLVEKVRKCIFCMLLCSWFQKGPCALGFYKIILIIVMSLFNKVVELLRVTSFKKRLQYRCFPVKFKKFKKFKEHLLSLVSFLIYSDFRSSRSQMFLKIVVLKNFAIFTGKQMCWSLELQA